MKTKKEIQNIKKACKIADSAFSFILKEVKIGISEKELARKLTIFLKTKSDGISFKPIVAFAKNSSHIHHKVTNRKLRKNDVIMFDFGAKVNGFCSDFSRTVFFKKINSKQRKIYNTVLTAQKRAIKYLEEKIKNSKSCKTMKVDKVARDYLFKKGYSLPHSLGHGIGKKVHQGPRISPKSKAYLKENMVFTIEPAIYEKEFGVRIEDVVLIKKKKIEILTRSSRRLILVDNKA